MINNYRVIDKSDSGTIETIYEQYDSKVIKKCVCECANPLIYKERVTRDRVVNCRFFGENDKLLYTINIPNMLAYHNLYSVQQGPSLLQDRYVIICGYSKGDTTCYNLNTGEEVWRSNADKVNEVFVYRDRIYAFWSAQKGGLYKIDAQTGQVISHCFKFKSELQSPVTKRLNERYLIIFILGRFFIYDMETDSILLSKKAIPLSSQFFSLSKIESIGSDGYANFIFKDIVECKGSPLHTEISGIRIPISDLFDGAVLSPFGDKIPTTKEKIDKKLKSVAGK